MFCTETSNALFFDDIEKISNEIWEELSLENNYLKPPYLRSLQKNHLENRQYYIIIKNKEKAVAIAMVQVIDFYIATLKSNYQNIASRIKKFGKKLHLLRDDKKLRILVCGNPYISGEYGISLKQNKAKEQIINRTIKAIKELVDTKKELKKTVDVFLLKDFQKQSFSSTNTIKKYNYHPFSVEPNMVLKTRPHWITFQDYLADLKTKFRVKAKRALTLSEPLKVVKITTVNFAEHKEGIEHLYQSVAKNASFNLTDFNIETYKDFLVNFGKNYILQTYWLADKMVGFISGFVQKEILDTHFVGIDYSYNKSHAIYQRLLYDYVNIGINQQVKAINFGRTASEIKSSIGAVPQELIMYMRHKKALPNTLLKLFLRSIGPTSFQQKKPFKKALNKLS